jgi:hypothetical protein
MRYIPDYTTKIVFQVPEEKNSYVNVRNVGASGRGDVQFFSTVTNIQSNTITLGNISDGSGGNLSTYRDSLKTDADLLAFFYSPASSSQPSLITVPSFTQLNVDFSASNFTNPNLAPLKYIVFGYDAQSGRMPNAREVVEIGSNALNPDLWNVDQYVQLNFSKVNQYVLPVVYRIWGNRVDFLGVIGNNKTGYSTSGNFRDLGLTEIPNWDTERNLPSFMSDVFSVSGLNVTLARVILGKEKLNIRPTISGSSQNTLSCFSEGQLSRYSQGNIARFVIDDTKYIQNAFVLAASGPVKDVFFPSGTYNISDLALQNSGSTSYSGVSIRGTGASAIIKRLPSSIPSFSSPGLVGFSGANANSPVSGTKMESVSVDGNRNNNFSLLSPKDTEISVNIRYGENVSVINCVISDNGGMGVKISDSRNISLTNNRILRTGRAYEQASEPLVVLNSENLVAQGNILELATTSPRVTSTDFSTINGNIIRGCGDKGFDLQASYQWNAQGNLAYSDNDSIIRSIDTYNNEYSRATIEVKPGSALDPVFMTVTYGGEPVSIVRNTVTAEIFNLNTQGVKGSKVGSFRVLQTATQLEAGIFSLTLPGTTPQQFNGEIIPSTSSLNNTNGYMYEVYGTVLIGGGPRGYRPLSIRAIERDSVVYPAVNFVNPGDLLSLQIHSEGGLENDRILITSFSNELPGWDENAGYRIFDIDTDSNSILLDPIPGFNPSPVPVEFIGGSLFIFRPNYSIADGNLFVHTI